ncbi:HD domain-containing protein [Alkaliphilus sp. MSJ-5]|uniref:HD domain-containing protein n=1 Tax=Alkaliphilus flagellatus TaxID=2841507 RepID=A0ABS6G4W7_9FIRM|nr:HD domain-containing protein [Alkaliphilus flagellatus]MBU5677224.1 HD domain-containing protein [Alkaliphilus flagellatus]
MNKKDFLNNTINIDYILDKIIDISILEQPFDDDLIEAISINKEQFENLDQDKLKYLFEKILMSQKPSFGIRLLEEVNLLGIFIPELQKCVGFNQRNPYHNYDVFDHILKVLDNTPLDLTLRWAALLHDIAKPLTFFLDKNGKGRFFGHDIKGAQVARKILGRLGYQEEFIKAVAALIETHMSRYNIMKEKGIKKLIDKVGEENIEKLFQLQRADIKGKREPYDFTNIEFIENMTKKFISSKE